MSAIQIDTREKKHAIRRIEAYFAKQNVQTISSKLYVGDYMSLDNPKTVIDRKQNLLEVCNNVGQGHARFCAELKKANDVGIKLIILVEHGGNIKTIEDVRKWVNPRLELSPLAISGERLYKIMSAISGKYGCVWEFCEKSDTGRKIIEILEVAQ